MTTLDGETRELNEPFSNGCNFPADPNGLPGEVYNCRCTMISQIAGFEIEQVTTSPKLGEMSAEELEKASRKAVHIEVTDIKALSMVLEDMGVEYKLIDDRTADIYAKFNITQLTKALMPHAPTKKIPLPTNIVLFA